MEMKDIPIETLLMLCDKYRTLPVIEAICPVIDVILY